MLTAKRPAARTTGSVRDVLSKQTTTSSGCSESELTAFVVSPAGPSGPRAVTTQTPVARCPMVLR